MQQIKGGASLLWMQFRKKAEENTKVYVNTETWRGLADGPCLNWVQWTVVQLPYVTRENRHVASKKTGEWLFWGNVSEGVLAKLKLHLSCCIPQLSHESEHAGQKLTTGFIYCLISIHSAWQEFFFLSVLIQNWEQIRNFLLLQSLIQAISVHV